MPLDAAIAQLVGGFNPSEKYEFVSWDDDIPNIWKNKKCSKPPTKQSFYKNQDFKNKDLIHVGLRTGCPIPATG